MVLDLEDGGLDASVFEEVLDEGGVEVGDTDVLNEARVDELLHGFPGLTDGDVLQCAVGALAVVVPLRGVADSGVNVLQGDGEVDEVKVEVVALEVLKGALESGADVLLSVVGVPEL